MNGVIPSRITEAREARALSMGDLADGIGVTRQSISKFERGIVKPSAETMLAISNMLEFPMDFFYQMDLDSSSRESALFFRSRLKIAKKVKTACIYQVKWADRTKRRLEEYVDFPLVTVHTIDAEHDALSMEDVENLALEIREKWGLGGDPIDDIIGIFENKGVIVSQFAQSSRCSFQGIDAFSAWKNGTPYILYHSTQKSAVRTRFSIAHELAHIIMHSAITSEDAIKQDVIDFADMQADRFAAAFLLPATSFPKDIRSSSLVALEIAKRKWGAALSTIIRRCEDLGILTDNQLNYLKRQMTTKKYWYKEPLDDVLSIEGADMLKGAIMLLLENNITTKRSLLDNIALRGIDLEKICNLPDDFFEGYERQRPALRLVE